MTTEYEQLRSEVERLFDANTACGEAQWVQLALRIFRYQAKHNALYAEFLRLLRVNVDQIDRLEKIPCLPISAFKHHTVYTSENIWSAQAVFESSGTTGGNTSHHCIRDLAWYQRLTQLGIEHQYGLPVQEYCTLALLPSYLERGNSSLVSMVDGFIQQSKYPELSGFFLYDYDELRRRLNIVKRDKIPCLLFGVAYALIQYTETYPETPLHAGVRLIETGGMKGQREEWTKSRLHTYLRERFYPIPIESEYGMTELLSQAYWHEKKRYFLPNPSLRVLLRDATDPLHIYPRSFTRTGGINLIDLANIDSCAFIASDDLGRYAGEEGTGFEILGRFDAAQLRGCNLLVQ